MGVNVGKLFGVFAAIAALLLSLFGGVHASASTRQRCGFVLIDDRIDASKALIEGQHDFTHDILAFNSTIFGADSASEIFSDYNQSLRDLAQDFRFALGDLRIARHDAVSEFRDGACTGASQARLLNELAFYDKSEAQLDAYYAQARRTLHKVLVAALINCC